MACLECGGTGILLDGSPCPHCKQKEFIFDASCLTVPKDYRGIHFMKECLPEDLGSEYIDTMDTIYKSIIDLEAKHRNYLIASPPNSGKTTLCYSAIQALYAQNVPTFPLLDTGELKRTMLDIDNGIRSLILEGMDANTEFIYTAPMLFVKIPNLVTFSTIDTILTILDRRTRRSNNTLFIYNGTWEELLNIDKKHKLSNIRLDGTMGTIVVKTFERKEAE